MKSNKYMRALFRDYGMVFVLLALCALVSIVTIADHHPSDVAAGRQLANQLSSQAGTEINVLIVAREVPSTDEAFALALKEQLQSNGANVLGVELGNPRSVRARLEDLGRQKIRVDYIATHNFSSNWGVLHTDKLKALGTTFPTLKKVRKVRPKSHRWPIFLTASNLRKVLDQNAPTAIVAIGMTLVIITAGIDLSVGSMVALASVITAITIRDLFGGASASGMDVTLAYGLTMLVCAGVGMLVGVFVTVFKVPPFVVTLGLMMVARGAAYFIADEASAIPLSSVAGNKLLYDSNLLGIQNQIPIMILLFVMAHVLMNHTAYGRYVYAVGGNVTSARLSGVPVVFVVISVYMICSLLSGFAGILETSHHQAGLMSAGNLLELKAIAAVVVGGTSLMGGEGKIFGTFIGVLILGVIENGLNTAGAHLGLEGVQKMGLEQVIYGALILVAVLIDQLKKKVVKPAAN